MTLSRKKYLLPGTIIASLLMPIANGHAALLTNVFDTSATGGWKVFANDDGTVSPGVGGQDFDAEYLLWKQEGSTLSLGLQTGFNLSDGRQKYGNDWYWSGDLALSINGVDYAVDFGLRTAGYSDRNVSDGDASTTGDLDNAGVYKVTKWNNDIHFDGSPGPSSTPFAMENGDFITDLLLNNSNASASSDSYYRMVSFNLADEDFQLDLTQSLTIDGHWTMSCGNDAIDGTFETSAVPEPTTMLLFGTGIAALAGVSRRKMRK